MTLTSLIMPPAMTKFQMFSLMLVSVTAALPHQGAVAPAPAAGVRSEFIVEASPLPAAHASTIVDTPEGLVASWFAGSKERAPDVGIWVSRHDGSRWSTPVEVANGRQADGTRHPAWNPVLFQPSN